MLISDELKQITERIVNAVPVERIYLFGSHAYGTPNEDSDYDLYIVLPNDVGMRPLDAIGEAYMSLIDMKRKTPMDVIANTLDTFMNRSLFITLERVIAREGVVIYERGA